MKVIIFVAGVAVGFVIGSRAGRGAYENMRRKWQGFSGSDPVQKVAGDVRDLAGRAASDLGDKVSEAVGKASDKLDEVTGKNAGTTPTEA
jgi:hypothetical protein